MLKKNIYLDNHASTKIDTRVHKGMISIYNKYFGNPHSSSHQHGWLAESFINKSRLKISNAI